MLPRRAAERVTLYSRRHDSTYGGRHDSTTGDTRQEEARQEGITAGESPEREPLGPGLRDAVATGHAPSAHGGATPPEPDGQDRDRHQQRDQPPMTPKRDSGPESGGTGRRDQPRRGLQRLTGPVEALTTSSGSKSSSSAGTRALSIWAARRSTTARPIASMGWRRVVSGGSVQFIRAESS